MILDPPFASVVPLSLPLQKDADPPLPAVRLDPLAWSRDGKTWPTTLRVKPVDAGRSPQFYVSEYHRKWQAVVWGPNAAKSSRRYLEADVYEAFKVAGLEPGDVIEVGRINRGRRASFTSSRTYYVVVERTEERLLMARFETKAKALKAGNLRKVLGDEREKLLASRAAIWEDLTRERSADEEADDEAMADAFL